MKRMAGGFKNLALSFSLSAVVFTLLSCSTPVCPDPLPPYLHVILFGIWHLVDFTAVVLISQRYHSGLCRKYDHR